MLSYHCDVLTWVIGVGDTGVIRLELATLDVLGVGRRGLLDILNEKFFSEV